MGVTKNTTTGQINESPEGKRKLGRGLRERRKGEILGPEAAQDPRGVLDGAANCPLTHYL